MSGLMIGLVLVSHSKTLANGIRELILEAAGPDFPVVVTSGAGPDHNETGTDAMHIAQILRPFSDGDGAVILMDLGSAVLSAEIALELLETDLPGCREKVRLSAAPVVERRHRGSGGGRAGAAWARYAAKLCARSLPNRPSFTPGAPASRRLLLCPSAPSLFPPWNPKSPLQQVLPGRSS